MDKITLMDFEKGENNKSLKEFKSEINKINAQLRKNKNKQNKNKGQKNSYQNK